MRRLCAEFLGLGGSIIKMVAGTYALEVELGVPIHRMWKVARKIDVVAPKLMPDLFGGSELLEGDGGTGTVRVITLGPGK